MKTPKTLGQIYFEAYYGKAFAWSNESPLTRGDIERAARAVEREVLKRLANKANARHN